jgi:hypothetical protein
MFMRRFRHLLLLVAVCSILLPRASFGWGREGHQIVATIAEARLSPRAKAGVQELLGGDSLSDVANWADEIRKERNETSTWHYVDIPYEMTGYDKERDGKNGNNVADKIVEFADVLNDRKQPKETRVEALKFLVHFIGDIHQPLHCAERNEDRGGNTRLVFFMENPKAVNLHSVWDSVILKQDMKRLDKKSVKEYSEMLMSTLDEKLAKKWMGQDPFHWANEGHDMAVKVVYAGILADGPPPKLGEEYLKAANPAVETQLQKGGVRLADVLNRIFR